MPGKPPAYERSRCSSCDVPSTLPVERTDPIVDAIGGTSEEAHRPGLERVIQAGGRPAGWVSLAVELHRDCAREETVGDVIEIVLTERLLKE